ncbi:hypothetical protein BCV72DRAFT_221311 [Rhizopus microsporus var. microsporus]|uniref:BAG domain-containing protein n=2 Tax=Rhizopus microsporus TaxID=58291 RepID=A0A2G4SN93_RHIZD|nr:uncharacterized protein RHIMIDRAFT_260241 [Rhizopus microsporus ATCC 52813]ORE10586.1 hypothetical protein BCV72DRAFT_221311 [Rhizopus microsporus var. microsporus]PHZ10258.1 hypothetical protein RHIMIDRAFT_260241 [Rhizopus microsporus ATCC 52813]
MYRRNPTRTWSIDDILQLQSLLAYEQDKRAKHIEECQSSSNVVHLHPIYRSASPAEIAAAARGEKQRLEQALYNLRLLKEEYRRHRTRQIQAYLDEYRRQALIRAVLQEEEERYYRQCIAAALEQQRVNEAWNRYVQMNTQQQEIERQLDEAYRTGYSEYRAQQLAELLKHLFEQQYQEKDKEYKLVEEDDDEKSNNDEAMAEVWKFLSDQKQDSETPRSAFLTSEHSALEENQLTPETSLSHEASEEEEGYEDEVEEDKTLEDVAPDTSHTQRALPPLADHVVTLKDLVNQLASQPVLVGEQYNPAPGKTFYCDEPKPSGIWEKGQPKKTEKPKVEIPEVKKKPYLPEHVFTEAEPTPTSERMSVSPVDEEEEEERKNQRFVDEIAAEQQKETKSKDPQKSKTVQLLNEISKSLESETSDIVSRWQHVLNQPLTFSKQKEGTLLLTATTDANRAYLGSEDELMRAMLKLDTIESNGDESIRSYRRELVQKCQSMLDQLDSHKQAELQKALSASKNQDKKKRRKRRHHRPQKKC